MVRGSCRQKLAISCCRESRENFCRCVSKKGKIGWCKVKIGAKFFSTRVLKHLFLGKRWWVFEILLKVLKEGYMSPTEIREKAPKRVNFVASYLDNCLELRDKWAHFRNTKIRATTYDKTKNFYFLGLERPLPLNPIPGGLFYTPIPGTGGQICLPYSTYNPQKWSILCKNW